MSGAGRGVLTKCLGRTSEVIEDCYIGMTR